MPNRKASLTQSELTRCIKAARAAGIDEFSIKVVNTNGTRFSIVVGKAAENADAGDDIDAMIERLP